jgi:rhomboid family GlyGly-CTERM serine protease
MAFDRAEIAGGQYWRLLAGHLTHCNREHLLWDVLMFGVLGAMIERRSRGWFLATFLGAAAAISLALWFGHAELEHYRGLSGIDSALFTCAMLMMLDEARQARRSTAWAIVALGTGFAAKIGWEAATGSTLFVDSGRAGFVPLPLVHVVGGIAGVVAWLGGKPTRCSGPLNVGCDLAEPQRRQEMRFTAEAQRRREIQNQ